MLKDFIIIIERDLHSSFENLKQKIKLTNYPELEKFIYSAVY